MKEILSIAAIIVLLIAIYFQPRLGEENPSPKSSIAEKKPIQLTIKEVRWWYWAKNLPTFFFQRFIRSLASQNVKGKLEKVSFF